MYRRAGVYHPSNTIPALPPVQNTRRSQQTRKASAVAGKKKTLARKKTEEPGRSETPRGSQLIQRYKHNSPRASFAPKNFQFSLQLQPQPAQPRKEKKEEEEVVTAEAARSPSPSVPAVMPASRRSRRISGVQPDLSLTPAMLSLTPARRAKDRSASRDRKRSLSCGVCPDPACTQAKPTHVLPVLQETEEIRENTEQEDKVEKEVEEAAETVEEVKTPVKEAELVKTQVKAVSQGFYHPCESSLPSPSSSSNPLEPPPVYKCQFEQ